jgi:hypothetical protein
MNKEEVFGRGGVGVAGRKSEKRANNPMDRRNIARDRRTRRPDAPAMGEPGVYANAIHNVQQQPVGPFKRVGGYNMGMSLGSVNGSGVGNVPYA